MASGLGGEAHEVEQLWRRRRQRSVRDEGVPRLLSRHIVKAVQAEP
jgi:hypothetical protein